MLIFDNHMTKAFTKFMYDYFRTGIYIQFERIGQNNNLPHNLKKMMTLSKKNFGNSFTIFILLFKNYMYVATM